MIPILNPGTSQSVIGNPFEGFFRQHNAIMMVLDESGNIIDANDSSLKFYGYPLQQMVKMNIRDINQLSTDELKISLHNSTINVNKHFKRRHRLASGEIRDVEVSTTSVAIDNSNYLFSIIYDITDHEYVAKSLIKSQQRYDLMFNGSNDAIFVSAYNDDGSLGLFTEVNDIACSCLGYAKNELLCMSPQSIGIAEKRESKLSYLGQLAATGNTIFEYVLLSKTGKEVPVELSSKVFIDNNKRFVLTIARDISARKSAESLIELLKRTIEISPDGAYWMDSYNTFIYINDAGCRTLGYTKEELLGNPLNKVNPSATAGKLARVWEMLRTKGNYTAESRHRRKDGGEIPVEVQSTYVQFDGKEYNCGIARDITERKKIEIKLMESEYFFKESQRVACIGSFQTDFTAGFWKSSEVLDSIFGIDQGYVRNVQGWLAIVHPADRQSMNDYLNGIIARQTRQFDHVYRINRIADGEVRWVHGLGENTFDENGKIISMIGTIQDITDRILERDELKLAVERYNLAATSADLGIWDWDIINNKMVWDDKMFNLYGIKDKPATYGVEIWASGLHPDDIAFAWEECQAALKGDKKYDIEFRVQRPDGIIRFIKANGTVIRDGSGKPIRMIGINRDITLDKIAQQEHLKLEQEILKNQKLESLGVMAGGIAHDFNNLMGGIYGYIDLANELSKDEKVTQYLSKAINTIHRTQGLTGQLLTFAKGGTPVSKIGALFPFIEETTRFVLSGSSISPGFEIPADLWHCNFDENQIGQVIDNIVINAQQAMPLGGNIDVVAENVSVNKKHFVLQEGNYVKISIKDTGVGIPEEVLPRIFDPFFTTKTKGHGLGLATCFSIIKRHGGTIDVESVPGKGTSFHIYLPASPESIVTKIQESSGRHTGTGRIVVVDDEPVMRESIGAMLEMFGYEVILQEEGKTTLEYFESETKANRFIVAILFDLTIPGGMGGREAIGHIRDINATIPVIAISGYAEDPVMAHPEKYGFTGSLCKPFKMAELAAKLNKHLP